MRSVGCHWSLALLLTAACGAVDAAEGALSRAEADLRAPRLARHFDAIDADGDGRITTREIRAWRKLRGGRGPRQAGERAKFDDYFHRADADGDGALSREEAAKSLPGIARKFDRIDSDRDGRVSLEEAHAWLAAGRGASQSRRVSKVSASDSTSVVVNGR
jgi:Ca2+-binding EF-hand superfamily protein